MRVPNTFLIMLSLVITGAAAECYSNQLSNKHFYPTGSYICNGEHEIVSI